MDGLSQVAILLGKFPFYPELDLALLQKFFK